MDELEDEEEEDEEGKFIKKIVYNMIEKCYWMNFNDKIVVFRDSVFSLCIMLKSVWGEDIIEDCEEFYGFILVYKFNKVMVSV